MNVPQNVYVYIFITIALIIAVIALCSICLFLNYKDERKRNSFELRQQKLKELLEAVKADQKKLEAAELNCVAVDLQREIEELNRQYLGVKTFK